MTAIFDKPCERCENKTDVLFTLGDIKVCEYCYESATSSDDIW